MNTTTNPPETPAISKHIGSTISIRWGTSRGRNTYGYTTCSLRDQNGRLIAACNGGGYDMRGTVVGIWLASTFGAELRTLKPENMPDRHGEGRSFYGLSFHDPNFDPGAAVIGRDCSDRTFGPDGANVGKTVAEAEAAGVSVGLERYQAIYAASSPHPTERHTVPSIDGACGISSVLEILRALGLELLQVYSSSRLDIYRIEEVKP
jgi:hypothetical protein